MRNLVVYLGSRLRRLRAFLTPVDSADVPELTLLHLRGARAGSWLLLILVIPLSGLQIAGGFVDPWRSIVYTSGFAGVYSLALLLLTTRFGRYGSEQLSFVVASAACGMAIFAGWPSIDGRNPFAHFAFVFPIAMTAFVPVRPLRALALGIEIALQYEIVRRWCPFPDMLPLGEAISISIAFGLAGALAAQSQRYLMAELYRARAVAESQSHELAMARDRALEASRVKTQFLANMSHEIRTPMAAILGFTDLIAEHFKDQAQCEEVSEAFDTVQRNGDHLLRLINDILDLSRLEVSEVQVERRLCSPDDLVAEIVRILSSRAREKGIELSVDRSPDAPRVLPTDPMRFRQIVLNIVENAIKFTTSGSVRIRLQAGRLDSGTALTVEVRDTGVGMSEDQLEKVFDPFVQADSSFTRRFGGTGLGLAISRRLALRLGGRLTATSALGEGSVFSLTLPALVEQDAAGERGATHERSQATNSVLADPVRTRAAPRSLHGRILLAEDGLDNQRLLTLLLRKAGAEVDLAENGRVAVELALRAQDQGRAYDLILMDMQMPEVDGYQATAQLRAAGYASPIVALTAHAMAGDSDRCLQAGCDAYLSKPISKTLLLEQAGRYLRSERESPAKAPRSDV